MNQSELATLFPKLDYYYPTEARQHLVQAIYPGQDYHSISLLAGSNLLSYAQMASQVGKVPYNFIHPFLSDKLSQKDNKAVLKWLCRQATVDETALDSTYLPCRLLSLDRLSPKARKHLTLRLHGD